MNANAKAALPTMRVPQPRILLIFLLLAMGPGVMVSCSAPLPPAPAQEHASTSTDIIREFLDDAAKTRAVSSLTLKDSDRWLQLWIVDAGQVESSVGYVFAEQLGISRGVRVRMNARHRVVRSTAITPRHGWPAFWQRLHEQRAFAIRDESELGKQSGAIHGIRIIFEHHEHGRTHYGSYNNPQAGTRAGQQAIMRLVIFLGEEFFKG